MSKEERLQDALKRNDFYELAKITMEEQNEIKVRDLDCEHEDIEYGDDGDRGTCKKCGATCDWHWEKEVVDNYPDYIKEVRVRVPHEWHWEES